MSDTELRLLHWRGGTASAERLVGAVLTAKGFDVDPQSPLGGPDGGKDLICLREGRTYVAAITFPLIPQDFKALRGKFDSDLKKALKHKPDGFLFLTNQRLTPKQRQQLEGRARKKGVHEVEIQHVERLVAFLDSPLGYGIRQRFLGVPMTPEELLGTLDLHVAELARTREQLRHKNMPDAVATQQFGDSPEFSRQGHPPFPEPEVVDAAAARGGITVEALLLLQRAVLGPSGGQLGLREREVWVGPPGSSPDSATFVPPVPQQIPALLNALLAEWNLIHPRRDSMSEGERMLRIASFHHRFVTIHPFVDGNGRIGRLLLQHQCAALLGSVPEFAAHDRGRYVRALQAADTGDLRPLVDEIRASMPKTVPHVAST